MALEHILLGILVQPASGYAVKQRFDQVFTHFWAAELSQIYRTLRRLEQDGLLSGRDEPSSKGPAKRVYHTTAKGRARLRAWLAEPRQDDQRLTYLAQVFFLAELRDGAARIGFFRQLRERHAAELAALQAIEAGWRASDPRYPDALPDADLCAQFTLALGLRKVQASIDWIDECIGRLERRNATEVEDGNAA